MKNEHSFVEGEFSVRILSERHGGSDFWLFYYHSIQREKSSSQHPRRSCHVVRINSCYHSIHYVLTVIANNIVIIVNLTIVYVFTGHLRLIFSVKRSTNSVRIIKQLLLTE